INFKQILDCLQQRGWDDLTEKWNSHGNASYLLAIAKEIAKRKDSQICHNQLKLLQFHPSYTYEDFVRGIVSKPNENGDGILYEAENKILAQFAQKALDNYNAAVDKTKVAERIPTNVFDA